MAERAGYLPGLADGDIEWREQRFAAWNDRVEVALPAPDPDQIRTIAATVRENRNAYLAGLPTGTVIAAIDQAIARLLDRDHPIRRKADALLPIVTGYDQETVRVGLTRYLETFRGPQLETFVAEDFANPRMLDAFQPLRKGGYGKAFGPGVIGHIWAGNVPGLPLWSLISGLLVKAGNVGKAASAEPLMAGWFAEALAEVDPRLAGCLAVLWWKGGQSAPEEALIGGADLILAYGRTKTLSEIRARVPVTKRFLGFGHKLSFGMISSAALTPDKASETARRAALDIVRYDQQGCYSPHLFYVERGGAVDPRAFAGLLGNALAGLAHRFPRHALSLGDAAGLANWREDQEMRAMEDDRVAVSGDAEGGWSVLFEEDDPSLAPAASNRSVKVVGFERLEEALPAIKRARAFLQTAGVAADPERLFALSEGLGAAGITRICALGQMTAPEAGWHHDGRFNLLDLVQIAEIERNAEEAADQLAPYRA